MQLLIFNPLIWRGVQDLQIISYFKKEIKSLNAGYILFSDLFLNQRTNFLTSITMLKRKTAIWQARKFIYLVCLSSESACTEVFYYRWNPTVTLIWYIYTLLLHVLVQELPMKVIPNCIIDEAFGRLELPTCLILENNIVIPPAAIHKSFVRCRPDSPHLLHDPSDLNQHLINKLWTKM